MATPEVRIQKFWLWFADHQFDFNSLSKPDEPFWDVGLEQIKRVDKRLWFELSQIDSQPREFVVTAEGHIGAFSVVEALISLAPAIKGWDFVALKPAMGFDFTTRYEGILFQPSHMWFLPLESASRPLEFGLRVGVRGLESLDATAAHSAVLVILDTALGERSAALDIQHTEIVDLPADPEAHGYIELPELPAYLAWRKRKRGLGSSLA